jgi:glutamine amidotransferase
LSNKPTEVVVVDYGMGNIGSIRNMLRHIGVHSRVASSPHELPDTGGVILPGVGHFDRAMRQLSRSGLATALIDKVVSSRVKLLGICLGMQLLCKESEEGTQQGLGLIDASVRRFMFPPESDLKVPHMGWNEVEVLRGGTVLGDKGAAPGRFYFVHSYYVDCRTPELVIGKTSYGIDFVSAVGAHNVTGVQFHPEKSHQFGLRLLRNFVMAVS